MLDRLGRDRSASGGQGKSRGRLGFFCRPSGLNRSRSVDRAQVPIGASLEQRSDDRDVPLLGGEKQGRRAMLVPRVDFCAVIDQKRRHFAAALGVERGGMQGGEAAGAWASRIGTPGEE